MRIFILMLILASTGLASPTFTPTATKICPVTTYTPTATYTPALTPTATATFGPAY